MEKDRNAAQTEKRKRVPQSQKAWKYIRDVNNTEIADLSAPALIDGGRTYTYGLMFREWERYASVFSALGMTGEKRARVGLLGSTSAEAIFAIYGLNMVGADVSLVPAYSALFTKKITETIRSERLTDFIITDDFAQANLIGDLLVERKALGLNNVIVLHVPVAGVTVHPLVTAVQEAKHLYLKGLFGPICMDELLAAYGSHPVAYAAEDSSDTAFILHTSGTTSGAGKPVALSDAAFNAAAAGFYALEGRIPPRAELSTAVIVDLSNAYSAIDQVHVPFAMGAAVAMVPGGVLNPWFHKVIPHCGITFLFTISAMFERWMKLPESRCPDFSSLRFVVLGGTSVSAADKRRYYEFMQKHGAGEITLLNGYGISELGGACCLSSPDLDDESIGWPLEGVSVRLLSEDSGAYLTPQDAPCEGVLYLSSPSLAASELDGREIVKYEQIDGTNYICTNDYARLESDGRLIFLGRANRYFINEAGRRYESGRVETEFSRQSGIESCCVVPVYIKTTHDNIPMLCVKTLDGAAAPTDVICEALRQVFIAQKTLKPDCIPFRVMVAGELPRNANGKIDLYKISRGEVEGETFTVETVRLLDRITDFRLTPYEEGPADMIKEVFDGITAEIKSNLPGKKNDYNNMNTDTERTEEKEMKIVQKAFEGFNSMNRMGMQMVKNVMGKIDEANPVKGFENASFQGVPGLKKVQEGMKTLSEKAAEKLPTLGKLGDAQGSAQDLAKRILPEMREQMSQMMQGMQEMNRIALDTMQSVFDQSCKMMSQAFETAEKLQTEAPAAPEKAEEPAAPENKAPEKAEKPAAAAKKAPARTGRAADSAKAEKGAAPAKKTSARKSKTAAPAAPAAEEKKEEKTEA